MIKLNLINKFLLKNTKDLILNMTAPLNIEKLKKISTLNKNKYKNALPFPHIVIDNFFEEKYINKVHNEFPKLSKLKGSIHHSGKTDEKLASPRGVNFQKKFTKNLLMYLNSSEFIDFLQDLSGINEKLIPDPHFIGGGLHQTYRGGFLKVHADFCKHPETKLDRRINLLIYINKNWKKNYMGELNLFDKNMQNNIKIEPIFNRIVIFNTTDFTYHGVPDPLNCPENTTRNSLALYYFSNGRPKNEVRSVFESNSTIYKARKGEKFNSTIKEKIALFIPPIFNILVKKIRNK